MEIKGQTIIVILTIVAILAVGFVVTGFITELSPEITPKYGRQFSAGAAPLSIDTGQTDLGNINVTQYNRTTSTWEYVFDGNWTYSDSTGYIVITPMINASGGNIRVVADYVVDVSSTWVKIVAVVGFVVVIALLFLIFKALPKKQ